MFILLQPISVKAFDFNKVRNDTIEARFYDPLRRALHHARPARALNVDDEKNLASLREISNFAHNNLLNILKL